MGIELELGILLGLIVFGTSVFAPFEVETPAWRKLLKWFMIIGLTLASYPAWGHWAALVPVVFFALGIAFHCWWCRKHDIHVLRATPRRRYYELRGWDWDR